jgi:tRNA(Phe) wybutosine-synthesizing methylase Tyw3
MRKLFLLLLISLFSMQQLVAQTVNENNVMVSEGKIYVVLAVCVTIFAGIVIYLIRLDRKISALEKKND